MPIANRIEPTIEVNHDSFNCSNTVIEWRLRPGGLISWFGCLRWLPFTSWSVPFCYIKYKIYLNIILYVEVYLLPENYDGRPNLYLLANRPVDRMNVKNNSLILKKAKLENTISLYSFYHPILQFKYEIWKNYFSLKDNSYFIQRALFWKKNTKH